MLIKVNLESICMIWGILLVAEKKKILYMVEAMGGGVFTYIVDLANELVDTYDMYIAYAVRKQTPANYKDYFDKRMHLKRHMQQHIHDCFCWQKRERLAKFIL